MKILIIHGPNLNLLGTREPDIYGTTTLEEINKDIETVCAELNIDAEIHQFDTEGDIVSCIGSFDGDAIIINPAAYTHTSLAIADALAAVDKPTVEVHLSNIYKREEVRHKSMTAPYVTGQISGLGKQGYVLAIKYLAG